MVRIKKAVASRRRRKRLLKKAKGFVGDRKNHIRLTEDAVMKAMAYNYEHRKQKKREFRKLWNTRISVAAKINGLSYSKLIFGLKKAGCNINRKMLSELAINDPACFAEVAASAKNALSA
ncbi:MAG: 50S ribosomal protein L20 [Simkaniaceae bacterium]